MKGCVLNNKAHKQRQPKWVVMADKLNPVEYIEWMHKTMAYKHPKRKNYSKKFKSYSKLKVCEKMEELQKLKNENKKLT